MMSFCKKSVNSFLGLSNTTTTSSQVPSSSVPRRRNTPSPATVSCGGLTFFTSCGGDIPRPINVVESSSFKPQVSFPPPVGERDSGGFDFVDDVGGGPDRLISCTESLGFESSDERRVDDKSKNNVMNDPKKLKSVRRSKKVEKKDVKRFPPPLSSFSNDGKPGFYFQMMRKDGRLEITEVQIHRPEILRASRENGRLKLHYIQDEADVDEPEDFKEKEEEKEAERWKFPAKNGGGEGSRRCHDVVVNNSGHHHHHRNFHGWGHHCVSIR